MRYLPSLGVGNTQLIKGKKKKGISKPFQKKNKKKKNKKKKKKKNNKTKQNKNKNKKGKPNLWLNTEKWKSAAAEAKVVSQLGIERLSGWGHGA